MKDQKKTEPKADKAKRTVLTPQERVAKAEAELAAVKAKAEAARTKVRDVLLERRGKLVDQIKERQAKVDTIDAELKELGHVDQVEAEAPATQDAEV